MKILFIGDSLIEYFDWQERFPGHKIVNLGIAGESVEGLFSRLTRVKEVWTDTDMIFIMTGINNVAMGDFEFVDSYRNIIDKLSLAYPKARIFINSLLPTIVDFIEIESVKGINILLKELAGNSGAEYLDIHRLFTNSDGRTIKDYLLDDGVHISNKGYEVWSKELEKIIR